VSSWNVHVTEALIDIGGMKMFSAFRRVESGRVLRLAIVTAAAMVMSVAAWGDPIHDAALKGDVKKIQAILLSDPKAVSAQDKNGDTALHLAALHGQDKAVQALLDAGADPNATNHYGAFGPTELGQEFAGANTHRDPVVLLNVHGDQVTGATVGYTPLHLAEFSINHKKIVQMLVAKGANVNAQAGSGATPLYFAVMRGQKDDAEFLLDHGANPNLPDAYTTSILDVALHMQYGSLIELLVAKGADVNYQDNSPHRPLTYALMMDDHHWADFLKQHGAHE
jgi:ankyrin repeat protein